MSLTTTACFDLITASICCDGEKKKFFFIFFYFILFFTRAICPPGWKKIWHIGVRRVKNQQMVGFITGVPSHIRVFDKLVSMVEINFLCVNKLYRDKRIAPVLIKEITRRVNLQNIWQVKERLWLFSRSRLKNSVLVGCFHCWCCLAACHFFLPILPSFFESEKVDCHWFLASEQETHNVGDHQVVFVARKGLTRTEKFCFVFFFFFFFFFFVKKNTHTQSLLLPVCVRWRIEMFLQRLLC